MVSGLPLQGLVVDGAAVQARRRARLQAAAREAQALEGVGQADRRAVAGAAGRYPHLADVNEAAQERAGGKHHGAGFQGFAVCRDHGLDPAVGAEDEILDRRGTHFEARLFADQGLHGQSVQLAVGLGARAAHGGTLAAVEDTELDTGAVDGAAHETIQRIDLAHQLALGEASDGGVAGHFPDGFRAMGEQEGARSHARRRRRRFTPGVAAAHHDYIGNLRSRHGATYMSESLASQTPSGGKYSLGFFLWWSDQKIQSRIMAARTTIAHWRVSRETRRPAIAHARIT